MKNLPLIFISILLTGCVTLPPEDIKIEPFVIYDNVGKNNENVVITSDSSSELLLEDSDSSSGSSSSSSFDLGGFPGSSSESINSGSEVTDKPGEDSDTTSDIPDDNDEEISDVIEGTKEMTSTGVVFE